MIGLNKNIGGKEGWNDYVHHFICQIYHWTDLNTSFVYLSIPRFLYIIPVSRVKWGRGGGGSGKWISTMLQKGYEEHFSGGGLVRIFKNFAVEGVDI